MRMFLAHEQHQQQSRDKLYLYGNVGSTQVKLPYSRVLYYECDLNTEPKELLLSLVGCELGCVLWLVMVLTVYKPRVGTNK